MADIENLNQNNFDSIITRDQCITVLNEKLQTSNYQLLNYTIAPISATKNGFMGQHLRLKCNILLNNQTAEIQTFFVKSKPPNERPMLDNFMEKFDIYKKEAIIYQLAKDSKIKQKWCPYFYAFFNNRSLVLEDLAANDFQLTKTLLKFDYDHCQAALKAMAAFHALSIKLDFDLKLSPNGSNKTLEDVYPDLLKARIYEDLDETKSFIARNNDSLLYMLKRLVKLQLPWNEMEKKVKFYTNRFATMMKPSTNYYNLILHGDVWGNNMLFKYDGDKVIECCLVDYQVARYGPPVSDVQQFLTINTTVKFQKENLRKLSDYYYQELTEQVAIMCGRDLNEVLSKTQYESSWKEYIVYSKIMAVSYKGMLLMDNHQDYVSNEEFIFTNRVKYLKDLLDTEAEFRNDMTEVLEDFQNTVLELK